MDLVTALENCLALDGGPDDDVRTEAIRTVFLAAKQIGSRMRPPKALAEPIEDIVQTVVMQLAQRTAAIVLERRTEAGATGYLADALWNRVKTLLKKSRNVVYLHTEGDEDVGVREVDLGAELELLKPTPKDAGERSDTSGGDRVVSAFRALRELAEECGIADRLLDLVEIQTADDPGAARAAAYATEQAAKGIDFAQAKNNVNKRHERTRLALLRQLDLEPTLSGENRELLQQVISRLKAKGST